MRVCEVCQTPLRPNRTRFCSKKCYGIANVKKIELVCAHCGKTFTTWPSRPTKHCSMACNLAHLASPEHFWKRVDQRGNCWLWTGSRNSFGYGQLRLGGRAEGHILMAHRRAWALTHGPIPEGQQVLHICDNPSCVRPDHLFLGSQSDNMNDMFRKGRATRPRGEEAPKAKLTANQVLEIRDLYAKGGTSTNKLAKQFGVVGTTIYSIVTRKTWKHI